MGLFRRNKTDDPVDKERAVLQAPSYVTIDGVTYPLGAGRYGGAQPSHASNRPRVDGIEQQAGTGQMHSVVSAAVMRRAMVVSQFWPTWRDAESNNMFRSSGLALFEDRTLKVLLKRAEAHIAYAGNAYFYRPGSGPLRLLQPEHVRVVLGSNASPPPVDGEGHSPVPIDYALDAEVIGYVHAPPNRAPDFILPEAVAHWRPEPHPSTPWLGAAWVTSIVREMAADIQADESSNKFFEQGSTPRLVFLMPNSTPEQGDQLRDRIEGDTAGLENHWRNHYLGGAADVKVVGASLKDLALKEFRGQLHTMISMRSGVPAQMLGIAEGMQGSALTQGNYGQARRQWADTFVAPYLDDLAAALEPLVDPPRTGRSYLSWDPDRVLLMQEDRKDAADILNTKMAGMRQGVDGGFDPDSVRDAFVAEDLSLLVHTGKTSVQLQDNSAPGGASE